MTKPSFRPHAALNRDVVTGRPVLSLECLFGCAAERVWKALTDDAELSQWTPWQVAIDPVPGGTVTLTFAGGEPAVGTVTAAVRPVLLEFHWPGIPGSADDEILCWNLAPAGPASVLFLEVTLQDIAHASQSAAGYHLSLLHLDTLLAGEPVKRAEIPPADPRFQGLVEHYDATLPSEV